MGRTLVFESGQAEFGRNRLINTNFRYAQRGSGTAIGGAFAYQTLDRWQIGHNAGDKLTQKTFHGGTIGLPTNKSTTSLQFFTTHSGPLGDVTTRQYIENSNIRDLSGKRASFGLWVLSDSADTFTISIGSSTVLNSFSGDQLNDIASKTITIPNNGVWTFVKVENFLLPDVSNGLIVRIAFSNFLNIAGSRNHHIAETIFNEGKIVAPWKLFAGGDNLELVECQRYFEKTYNLDVAPQTSTSVGALKERALTATSQGGVSENCKYSVRKRVVPIFTIIGSTGVLNNMRDVNAGSDMPALANGTGQSSSYVTNLNALISGNNYLWHWTADAEIG